MIKVGCLYKVNVAPHLDGCESLSGLIVKCIDSKPTDDMYKCMDMSKKYQTYLLFYKDELVPLDKDDYITRNPRNEP
jgi:hypothetical protein